MKYMEITVRTTNEGEELVSDIFFDCCLLGVSIKNINDLLTLNKNCHKWDYIEEDIFEQYSKEVLISGFSEMEEFESAKNTLNERLSVLQENAKGFVELGSLEMTMREIEGDDWLNSWKAFFKPLKIKDIVICPKWIDYEKTEEEKVLLLDVGMAFGTGEHETTSMCIELMQDFDLKGKTVIDVGCGSGILGIATILLGAKKAIMSDIDLIAVEASINNAKLNGVLESCDISEADLLSGEKYDVDFAISNITAEVLITMADKMAELLKPKTPLILSGILKDRLSLIEKSYCEKDFEITKIIEKGDWLGVSLLRK